MKKYKSFILWFIRTYIICFIAFFPFLSIEITISITLVSIIAGFTFYEYDKLVNAMEVRNNSLKEENNILKNNPYSLTQEQINKMDKWENKIRRKNKSGFEVILGSSSGIGIYVEVRTKDGKEKLDITDYSTW